MTTTYAAGAIGGSTDFVSWVFSLVQTFMIRPSWPFVFRATLHMVCHCVIRRRLKRLTGLNRTPCVPPSLSYVQTYEHVDKHYLTSPYLAIPTVPQGGNHTKEFTNSARTIEAHNVTLTIVKALSMTAFRAVQDGGFYQEVPNWTFLSGLINAHNFCPPQVKKAYLESRSTHPPVTEEIRLA